MLQTNAPYAASASPSRRSSLSEQLVVKSLDKIRHGVLTVEHPKGAWVLGTPQTDGLSARVRVNDAHLWQRLILGGTLGAAEGYMDGEWDTDDLTSVVRIFARNIYAMDYLEAGAARIGGWIAKLHHAARKNTLIGSKKNIRAHYDLGNDFFSRMLDPSMTYSAGIFENESSSLEDASIAKLDRLCQRLDLQKGDHLLEIGTGWGSMAIHAAKHYGVRVTTTTISREQRAYAQAQVEAAGLQDRIEILDRDYRRLEGRYSKIVSVEMIEAVGAEYYGTFFEKCASLLEPNGLLAMQAITIADHRYEAAKDESDFIKQYIFPGSCIPSATALLSSATQSSDFVLRHFEDFRFDYAKTLRQWRRNLAPHEDHVVRQYGERFWRMWMYYLAYCEAGFLESYIGCAQLLFSRTRSS